MIFFIFSKFTDPIVINLYMCVGVRVYVCLCVRVSFNPQPISIITYTTNTHG